MQLLTHFSSRKLLRFGPQPGRFRPQYGLLLFAFVFAGCLPFSCGKKESRDLFPADSLSRALAASIPVDTMEVVDQLRTESPPMSYPSSLGYAPDGTLWSGDLLSHRITGFAETGTVNRSFRFDDLKYPYILGFRGDTLVVFTPEDPRILQIEDAEIVRTINLPNDPPVSSGNQYATTYDGGYFYKVVDKNFGGYITRLNNEGRETARWNLPGEYWRYAGALRMWSDSLMSLSGYLPQIHLLLPGAGDTDPAANEGLDSLVLHGFDSPMLSRTRLFILDELNQPPLLSASAVAIGERLFVLNMRPGWLRVDVFDRSGDLQYILTQPTPEFNTDYFPTDLAVRILSASASVGIGGGGGIGGSVSGSGVGPGSGTVYELAVSVYKPEARIDRFRWIE